MSTNANARSVSKEKATPIAPRAVKVETATQAAKQPPFVTGIQERIADIIGELMVFGGTRRNLDALCKIAADHEARRIYGRLMKDKPFPDFEKNVADRAADYAPVWYDDLAAARANRPRLPEAIRPEAKTVSEMILSGARHELEYYFEHFLTDAMPSELYFLQQVMLTWDSIHPTHKATGFEAFHIANAFEDQIRRGREYVRVPSHLTDAVEAYLKSLLKAYPGEDAA